jgi:hypothetical protein
MSRVQSCFGRRTDMTWALTTTIRARRCVFLRGQVRSFLFAIYPTIIYSYPRNVDRILYRGNKLELSVYSRAELKGSDHRPGMSHVLKEGECAPISCVLVYAAFRASVCVIDHTKKAVLGRLLAESVASTPPGEPLDEKLAALTFSHSDDCKSGKMHTHMT